MFSRLLLLCCCLLIAPPIMAQDASGEFDESLNDFTFSGDVFSDEEEDDSGIDWSQYLVGEIGYVNAFSGFARRENQFLDIGVDVPWSWGRFYANYAGVKYDITVTQTLDKDLKASEDRPREKFVKFSEEDTDWRETFLQLNLGRAATFTVGRQRNAWGQFELFSPVALMQPLTDNIISFIPSKVDLLHAQDQAKLVLYPTSKSEIHFYDMENVRTDKAVDDNAKILLTPRFLGDKAGQTLPLGDEQKEHTNQKAVRLLFYPSWGVLGLTRHEGVNGLNPLLRAPTGFYRDEEEEIELISSVYDNDDATYLFYPKGKLTGIEVAVSNNRFTYRAEHAIIETYNAPGAQGNLNLFTEEGEQFTDSKWQAFQTAIADTSRGGRFTNTSLYPATRTFSGIGIGYQGPVWNINVDAFAISTYEPDTHAGREIKRTYQALEEESELPDDPDFGAFPLVSAYRSAGEDDRHYYGYALGVLGVGFGIGAIYSYKVTDDLSLAGSVGYADISGFDGEQNYDTKSSSIPTLQFSVRWQF